MSRSGRPIHIRFAEETAKKACEQLNTPYSPELTTAIWTEVRLLAKAKRIAYWTALLGTYLNWLVTTLAAVFGTAADSPISAAGHSARAWQETLGPNHPSDTGILDSAHLCSNTVGMKVAVSIPDDVFAEAESLAKDLKASRSEIYSRALGEFLGRHAPDRVTEQMNDVISSVGEGTDDFSRRAARRALRRVEW